MVAVVNLTRRTVLARQAVLGTCFSTRLRGLMFRRGFEPFDGLWLSPTSEIHMFWVRFPIDLVWLDGALTVVKLTPGIRPWRLDRARGAVSVLELPAGVVAASGTAVGDAVAFVAAAAVDGLLG